jgi:pSer/pThr/pTyr-binding forkhead associated (FHA) protein
VSTQRGRKSGTGEKAKGWLASVLGRGSGRDHSALEYDLVVIEGADARASFPIDRPEIQIGRATPGSEGSAGIQLTDRSVSSKHALLSREDGRITIQHLPSATNPTLVNGRRVKRKRLRDGDRIVLGLAVLELRARPLAQPKRAHSADQIAPSDLAPSDLAPSDRAEIETAPLNVTAALVLREGVDELCGERFPLVRQRTSIGRDDDCNIVLEVAAVSRSHAALEWEDDQLILVHESAVNPTQVNGMEIRDRRRVFHGDEIRISESVVFEVVLEAASVPASKPRTAPQAAATAQEATRHTSPPVLDGDLPERPAHPEQVRQAGRVDPSEHEATRISNVVEPAPQQTVMEPIPDDFDALDATRIDDVPDLEAAALEGAPEVSATRVFEEPATPISEEDATRITPTTAPAPAASSPDPQDPASTFSEGDATRIAPAPAPAASSPDPQDPASTFSEGDATRIAPAPAPTASSPDPQDPASAFSEGDATRIAPAPAASSPDPQDSASAFSAGDATRIAPAPNVSTPAAQQPDASDEAKTMIRPSPFAEPAHDESSAERYGDAARTRVVDLDARLTETPDDDSESRTMLRPSPFATNATNSNGANNAPSATDAAGPTSESSPTSDATIVHSDRESTRQAEHEDEREQQEVSDAARTVIRRVPQREPARAEATTIIEPDPDPDEDEPRES